MNNQPLVTVVTVCRNCLSQLRHTINSVLSQNYKSIDYQIVDGASTDGTVEMLQGIQGIHWTSEADNGIYDAMNKAVNRARGEWIIFMNAGDTFASDDTLQQVFSTSRDADVIYGDVIKGGVVKHAEPPHNSHRMFFCHQSAFVRTSCLKAFPFDIHHRMSADFKQIKQLYLSGKRFLQLDIPIAVFDTSGVSNAHRSRGLYDNILVIRETDSLKEQIRLLPRLLFTYLMCRLRGK